MLALVVAAAIGWGGAPIDTRLHGSRDISRLRTSALTPSVTARARVRACDPDDEDKDLTKQWSEFQRQNDAEFTAASIAEAELDPKRRALWEQLRRAAEIDAVKGARATLRGEAEEEDAAAADWKVRSRALSELQYWLITTGNPDAESAMIDIIQKYCDDERWVAIEADGLLRKAWAVHRNATVNMQMERGRSLLREGDARLAERTFDEVAHSVQPPWPEAHRWRAKVLHLALNDAPAAIEAYEAALKQSPKNYPVLFELGSLLIKDAASEAQFGGPRALGSAERATRGAELLGRAAELNPLLEPKVRAVLGTSTDDE